MKKILAMIIAATLLITACSSGSTSGEETVDEVMKKETLTRDGDYIVFGHYEQDGNESNGPEPIEWEIVSEEGDRTLLMSRYILDRQRYNTELADVTWETCSLRSWLNNDFYNAAFNDLEKILIITVMNSNADNVFYGTDGGNDTEDKVFCLSLEELHDNYIFEEWNEERREGTCRILATEVTRYAAHQGVYVYDKNGCGSWLLRSAGSYPNRSANVGDLGQVSSYGGEVNRPLGDGVRPAIYISSSLIPQKSETDASEEQDVQNIDAIIVRDVAFEDEMSMFMAGDQLDLDLLMYDGSYLDCADTVIAGHPAYVTYYDLWKIAMYYASPETRLSQEVPVYRIQAYDGSEEYEVYLVTDNYEFETTNGHTVPEKSARFMLEVISQMRGHSPGEGSCPFDGWGRWYAVSVTPTAWN